MKTLRFGVAGEDVAKWQYFLRGAGLYLGETHGKFDEDTKEATVAFQQNHGLDDDGIAGNQTLGQAMKLGFDVTEDDDPGESGPNWPPKPNFGTLGAEGRTRTFGAFEFEPAPVAGNPEAIKMRPPWEQENIQVFSIPQLKGIKGAPGDGRIRFHRLVGPKVVELFDRWQAAGLIPLVLTFDGSFVPRYIRGSRTTLSSHSHGSAFDINARWNGFGAQPALVSMKGTLRRLVPIANELGFYWGGHFDRKDGMHFELVKL